MYIYYIYIYIWYTVHDLREVNVRFTCTPTETSYYSLTVDTWSESTFFLSSFLDSMRTDFSSRVTWLGPLSISLSTTLGEWSGVASAQVILDTQSVDNTEPVCSAHEASLSPTQLGSVHSVLFGWLVGVVFLMVLTGSVSVWILYLQSLWKSFTTLRQHKF